MKKQLLKIILILFSFNSFAQAPEIEGDVLLCPWTDGTATIITAQTYDTYQWYFKYWFLPDDYEAIDGATSASFTYDWYTYDQALLKVVVTLDGETYESNTIQVDSWAWTSMFVVTETNENVVFDPDTETFLLCEGATFNLSINNPPYDTNIVWYRNDIPIEDATNSYYTVIGPGYYYVSAAPSFCPNNTSNSLGINVAWNPDCSLSVDDPTAESAIKIYPNPVKNELVLNVKINTFETYNLIDLTGKLISTGTITASESMISTAALSSGVYVLQLIGENHTSTHKIIKE